MSGYFLIDNPNHHGGHRGNGEYGWFYRPPRRKPVRCIGVHTAESSMDNVGPDTGAEGVANYLSNVDRPASYHEIYDSDSAVLCLPWDYTAFGIRSFNSPTIQISFATATHYWGDDPDWDEAALQIAARRVREMVRKYGIPLRWLTRDEAEAGHKGFVRHSTMDPTRRSDPGDGFPAGRFFDLVGTQDAEGDWLTMASEADVRKVVREEIERFSNSRLVQHHLKAKQNDVFYRAREIKAMLKEMATATGVDKEALAKAVREELAGALAGEEEE